MYAEDNGIPEKKGYCPVIIMIIDVNDCPPVFDPVLIVNVKENVPPLALPVCLLSLASPCL